MDIDFTGKVALITGASSGIGAGIAQLFAKLGAELALVGRNKANLQSVADKCEKEKGLKPLQIIVDLASDDGPEITRRETINHFGKLDILVNNAGVAFPATIEKTDMETFDKVFSIDVRAAYSLTRLLVPELIKTKGNIINISSIAATAVLVGNLPYAMAKAALSHFSREIAVELAPKGVRVNTVAPGIAAALNHFSREIAAELAPKGVRVNTVAPGVVSNGHLVKRMANFNDEQYQDWLKRVVDLVPMGEVIDVLDVAKMVAYLVSDHSRLVTGITVEVDAGMQYSTVGSMITELAK